MRRPAARPEGPAIYHLKRVPELRPTAKHPYCGCWAADYGPQGLEVGVWGAPRLAACRRLCLGLLSACCARCSG